jgi:hypothetical protein
MHVACSYEKVPQMLSTNLLIVADTMFILAFNFVLLREMRNVYRISFGKFEEKRPVGEHKHICEDNIKFDFKVIGWEGMD